MKERSSNFELLRIIAILMVITSHFCIYSGVRELHTVVSINSIIIDFLKLGVVANYIFIIITGYFMVNSNIKYQKIIALILETTFYSVVIYIFLLLLNLRNLNIADLTKSFFPIFFGNWFIIYYILLYILIPYINLFIKKISENELKKLIMVLVLINFVVPTLSANIWKYNYHDFFITAYLIGAYIRLYYDKKIKNNKKIIKTILLIISSIFISIIITQILGYKLNIKIIANNSDYFIRNTYSIFTLVLATLIVVLFRNKKIKNFKTINSIASTTLGIYLIHENNFIREIIWQRIFPVTSLYNSKYLFLAMIVKVTIVFIMCTLIEKSRQLLLGNLEEKLSKKIFNKITSIKTKVGGFYENKKI